LCGHVPFFEYRKLMLSLGMKFLRLFVNNVCHLKESTIIMKYFKSEQSFHTLKELFLKDPLITTYIHTFRFVYYCDLSDGFILKTGTKEILDLVKRFANIVEIDETAASLKYYERGKSICYFGEA